MAEFILRDMLTGATAAPTMQKKGRFFWTDGALCMTAIADGLERRNVDDGGATAFHEKVYAVVELPPSGSGTVDTPSEIEYDEQNDRFTRAHVLSQAPATATMVQTECARRLALGFDHDFGGEIGVHRIGTTDRDMAGWDEVTTLAQALINAGDTTTTITILTDTGPAAVTAMEWNAVLLAAAAFRQPIWAASFTLQATDPIPADYAADEHWP